MQRFKNILAYAKGGPTDNLALDLAADLAHRNGGRLTVVTVVEELPRELSRLAAAVPSEDLERMALKEAREMLERSVASALVESPPPAIDVLYGKPFVEIIRAVLRRQHDLVIVVDEARKGLMERFTGSTSLRLMRKCPCPVWVVKPDHPPRAARILAAVDPDPLDVVRTGLNTKIMELATSMAESQGGELQVVHAWEALDPALLRGWQAEAAESGVTHWIEQNRVLHQRLFDDLLAQFGLDQTGGLCHLIAGEADTVIPDLVAKEQIDLLVMGTVGRVGIEGYFIGNTAETVLHRVSCSVLTVKPEGFVSPIKAS